MSVTNALTLDSTRDMIIWIQRWFCSSDLDLNLGCVITLASCTSMRELLQDNSANPGFAAWWCCIGETWDLFPSYRCFCHWRERPLLDRIWKTNPSVFLQLSVSACSLSSMVPNAIHNDAATSTCLRTPWNSWGSATGVGQARRFHPSSLEHWGCCLPWDSQSTAEKVESKGWKTSTGCLMDCVAVGPWMHGYLPKLSLW